MLNMRLPIFRLLNIGFICLIVILLANGNLSFAQAQQKYCVEFYRYSTYPFTSYEAFTLFDVQSKTRLPKIIAHNFLSNPNSSMYSPDGKYVSFAALNETGELSLYLGSVETGNVTLLHNNVNEAGGTGYWSPDNQYFTFRKLEEKLSSVVIVRPDGTDPHEFRFPRTSYFDYPVIKGWSADSAYIAVGMPKIQTDGDNYQLYIISVTEMKIISSDLYSEYYMGTAPVGWSPKGHRLAFLSDARLTIWSPENGIEVQVNQSAFYPSFRGWQPAHRMNRDSLTYSTPPQDSFRWSPDGEYLTVTQHPDSDRYSAFYSDLDLREVFRSTDGKLMNIPHEHENQFVVHWSDDNWLTMFDFISERQLQDSILARVNVVTGERKIISEPGQYLISLLHFRRSPNGRYIAYITKHKDKGQEVETPYRVAIYDTKTKTQKVITQENDYDPAEPLINITYPANIYWSPDNEFLITEWGAEDYKQPHQLLVAKPDGIKLNTIMTDRMGNWAWISNSWLYNVKFDNERYDLELINLQTGKIIPVASTTKALDFIPISLSPDGRFVAALVDHRLYIVALGTADKMTVSYPRWERVEDTRNYIYANRLAWSADNSMIAYLDEHLVIADANGKELHRSQLPKSEAARGLAWVPCPN